MTGPNSRIQDAPTQRYRRAISPTISRLIDMRFNPSDPLEFYELAAEYTNIHPITKGAFEGLASGLEHLLPYLKSSLPWRHAVLHSWSASCH